MTKHLESPAVAEDKQRRKLQYVPPLWPIVVVVAIIIGVAIALNH
jgi:multisubunit Na+/H+ antiporter MnhC subunit